MPSGAQDGRPLRTLPHGVYQCALPGDAAGDAFETTAIDENLFDVILDIMDEKRDDYEDFLDEQDD